MAPHSSTLAWKIPWTEEPGRLQSMGSLSRTRLSDFTSLPLWLVLFNRSLESPQNACFRSNGNRSVLFPSSIMNSPRFRGTEVLKEPATQSRAEHTCWSSRPARRCPGRNALGTGTERCVQRILMVRLDSVVFQNPGITWRTFSSNTDMLGPTSDQMECFVEELKPQCFVFYKSPKIILKCIQSWETLSYAGPTDSPWRRAWRVGD